MSECRLAQCEEDRKLIRREFNKWTKNILSQIGLETISKNIFNYDINMCSRQKHLDDQIPADFNPSEICLFCTNRQEYLSTIDIDSIWNNDEQFPIDLSTKKSDILPQFHSNNFSVQHFYMVKLAKQMAYSRLLEEIECQRTAITSKLETKFSNSSILTDSIHVNHILNNIMIRILTEIFQKQTNRSAEEQELFDHHDRAIFNSQQHNKPLNSSSSSHSSTSSLTSVCSSSVYQMDQDISKSNYSSSHISHNRSKILIGTDGKQVRPKRGQYRRYESEQLEKAVAAVLSKKMSVHKAGSYFGVPHSTLEYKVKASTTVTSQ